MIQGILVAIIFTGAAIYLGWVLYRQFTAKSVCASGCGKCSVVDFTKIEKELRNKEMFFS